MFGLFKKSPQTGETIKEQDIAYGEPSLLYTHSFDQYNPDDLLGRKGFKIYRKMMTDEQVKAVVRFHRDAVTGRAWTFEDCPELSKEENERRKAVFHAIIRKLPGSFKTKLDLVMAALYQGFSLTEKTFGIVEIDGVPWVGIKALTKKPYETFYFNLDDFGALDNVQQQTGSKRVTLKLSDFIHYACNPDVHEYYGQSELREAYRPYWCKDVVIALQNIYLERAAGGFVWAKPAQGSTLTPNSKEYAGVKSVLSAIRNNAASLFPANIDLNVVTPSDTQAFDRAITSHDKAIAKALLMPNLLGLSEQGPNGSRALGDTQLEAFLWMLDAEAGQLEEVINEQLFADLARLNFADGLYPAWRLKSLSNKQIMETVAQWAALTGAKVVRRTEDDEDHIRASLGFPEFNPEAEIRDAPAPAPTPVPGPPPTGDEEEGDEQDSDDETIMGTSRQRVSAEMAKKKAAERVDFKVIARRTDDAAEKAVESISAAATAAISAALADLPGEYSADDVAALKLSGRDMNKINSRFRAMLQDGWTVGIKHAKDELGKASGEAFKIDFARLDQDAAEYFKGRAFYLTGNLTNDMMAVAKNTLYNGLKDNQTRAQIIDNIYESYAKAGFITEDDAEAQMGRLLTAREGTTARLNTVVRTNTFEAVNEARYSYFTDPGLDNFVQALEYSAILDGRTTSICQNLDGHIHAATGDVWNDGFRPPNHYNCRSLLIPVTEFDTWEESPYPETRPQEGFS